jgi:hypothetical protein
MFPKFTTKIICGLILLVFAVFFANSSKFQINFATDYLDRARILSLVEAISEYQAEFGEVPRNIFLLAAFCKTRNISSSIRDRKGELFSYHALTNEQFAIFRDQPRAQIDPKNFISFSNRPPSPQKPYEQISLRPKENHFIPYLGLSGSCLKENCQFTGEIILNKTTFERLLMVRDTSTSNLVSIAPDKDIQEFIWAPSGTIIYYTHQPSPDQDTQVIRWDFQKNETIILDWNRNQKSEHQNISQSHTYSNRINLVNIITISKNPFRLWLSLHTVDKKKQRIEFFDHIYAVNLSPNGKRAQKLQMLRRQEDVIKVERDLWWVSADTPRTEGARSVKEQHINNLPVTDDLELTIQIWQNHIAQSPKDASTPHLIWLISLMYFDYATAVNYNLSVTLRSFGIELLRSITLDKTAPLFLRNYSQQLMTSASFEKHLRNIKLPEVQIDDLRIHPL